jgi:hypothetical protein
MVKQLRRAFDFNKVHDFVGELFEEDMHEKRVLSLANATVGVMTGATLAVATIGQALAQARGLRTKHAVKQVDRLLANGAFVVWDLFAQWVPYVVAERESILVALDWTDFDADGHSVIALNLVTGHGRATPLVWKTVKKSELKGQRALFEDEVLQRLSETLPAGVSVTVLADRGFFDVRWLEALQQDWGFGYVVRMRGHIQVTSAGGETRPAAQWVGAGGRARTLRNAEVTGNEYPVPTVVCVQAKGMKASWCLVASDPKAKSAELVNHYAKRWTIETSFRDTKDLQFGMGLSSIHTKSTQRRDRLWLLSALAIALLTLLGAAGEALGYDRMLKANTVKKRTHSLFRQGCMLYDLIPNMPEQRLRPLIEKFEEMLRGHSVYKQTFGLI